MVLPNTHRSSSLACTSHLLCKFAPQCGFTEPTIRRAGDMLASPKSKGRAMRPFDLEGATTGLSALQTLAVKLNIIVLEMAKSRDKAPMS